MSRPLHIKTFTLGPWMTNCYVVFVEDGGEQHPCWIIDAGFEPEPMLAYLERERIVPEQVVLTHAHVDHIAGLAEVRRAFADVPIVIHEAEQAFPGDAALNLSIALGAPIVAPEPTGTFRHGDVLALGGERFEVRHTPGHSPGGVCLYNAANEVALVGDTLFAGSIGRSDFPTSDEASLYRSIREQLFTLPDATRVLPGHGPATTIGDEKATNPFVGGGR